MALKKGNTGVRLDFAGSIEDSIKKTQDDQEQPAVKEERETNAAAKTEKEEKSRAASEKIVEEKAAESKVPRGTLSDEGIRNLARKRHGGNRNVYLDREVLDYVDAIYNKYKSEGVPYSKIVNALILEGIKAEKARAEEE